MLYNYNARVLRVVDGDTLDLMISLGLHVQVKERCRLLGVNTPETFGVKKGSVEYKAGMSAKAWLIRQLSYEYADCVGSNMAEEAAAATAIGTAKFDLDSLPVVRIVTTKDKKGKYGRYLATLYVGDDTESINAKLVKMGFGAEY